MPRLRTVRTVVPTRTATKDILPEAPEATRGRLDAGAGFTEADGARPRTVIRPSTGWSLGLGGLWHYKQLLYFVAWRDVKVRYKQTVFGTAWAVIQPVMLMVVFSVVLGKGLSVPSEGIPYPIFVYVALVPWALFAKSLEASSSSLVMSSDLVEKIYFPRLILPVAATGSFLLDFVISFGVLIGMMFWYGVFPTAAIVWLPFLTILGVLVALAVGTWLSALYVRYRDVRHAVPFLIQLWLFATPVAYPEGVVPEGWSALLAINPMTGVVEGFRWALLGTETQPDMLIAVSVVVTILVLVSGLLYFQRTERTFADVI